MAHNLNPPFNQIANSRKRSADNQQVGASARRRLNPVPQIIATAPMLNSPRPVHAANDAVIPQQPQIPPLPASVKARGII